MSGQAVVGSSGELYWGATSFGADQEASVTLAAINPEASEIDLLLKCQDNDSWAGGVIEIWYQPGSDLIQVVTYTSSQGWVQQGGDISATFANGDRLGARARADGIVEVYKNGTLLATRDITSWPYYAGGGYIGLWMISAPNGLLDDFGGGTRPLAYQNDGQVRMVSFHTAQGSRKGAALVKQAPVAIDATVTVEVPPPPIGTDVYPQMTVGPTPTPTPTRTPFPVSTPTTGQIWRSYYYVGSIRVAMRESTSTSSNVYYLLTDQLGSTNLTVDANGNKVGELRYKPWGETRYTWGSTPTDRQYTGQINESDLGLYFYNARFYDSSLGRFVSPDSLIPQPGNVQAWDRFAYVQNNPIQYNDPSGHKVTCDADENCKLSQQLTHLHGVSYWKAAIKGDFGIKMVDDKMKWSEKNLITAYNALSNINEKLNGKLKTMVGGTTFTMPDGGNQYYGITYSTGVTFHVAGSNTQIPLINFLHETAHLIDAVPAT